MGEIPELTRATENLIRDGLITVYEDDLVAAELTLLSQDRAVQVVADPLNWWRDEDDDTVPAATSVFALDITALGRRHISRPLVTSHAAGGCADGGEPISRVSGYPLDAPSAAEQDVRRLTNHESILSDSSAVCQSLSQLAYYPCALPHYQR